MHFIPCDVTRSHVGRYDWWLPQGLAGYAAGLCMSRMFGSTWYQHWIMKVRAAPAMSDTLGLSCLSASLQ